MRRSPSGQSPFAHFRRHSRLPPALATPRPGGHCPACPPPAIRLARLAAGRLAASRPQDEGDEVVAKYFDPTSGQVVLLTAAGHRVPAVTLTPGPQGSALKAGSLEGRWPSPGSRRASSRAGAGGPGDTQWVGCEAPPECPRAGGGRPGHLRSEAWGCQGRAAGRRAGRRRGNWVHRGAGLRRRRLAGFAAGGRLVADGLPPPGFVVAGWAGHVADWESEVPNGCLTPEGTIRPGSFAAATPPQPGSGEAGEAGAGRGRSRGKGRGHGGRRRPAARQAKGREEPGERKDEGQAGRGRQRKPPAGTAGRQAKRRRGRAAAAEEASEPERTEAEGDGKEEDEGEEEEREEEEEEEWAGDEQEPPRGRARSPGQLLRSPAASNPEAGPDLGGRAEAAGEAGADGPPRAKATRSRTDARSPAP
jgi:hypothetical protein